MPVLVSNYDFFSTSRALFFCFFVHYTATKVLIFYHTQNVTGTSVYNYIVIRPALPYKKIPRHQPRDLFCLELFAMFANLVANGARSFASGLAGSRALAAAAGAQGLFQHSFINSS